MSNSRAVKPTKRADDRRRGGLGDNVAFTAKNGISGLGAGRRATTLVSRTLTPHQFTNRVGRNRSNGKGKKTI